MTTETSTQTADPEQAEPVEHIDGVPRYRNGEAPPHLVSVTELGARRLKLAEGQQPLAYIRTRGRYRELVALYDPEQAAKMRPLSARQQQQMTARRTCPQCGEVRDQPVTYPPCHVCRQQAEEERRQLQARTCWKCSRVAAAPYPAGGFCLPCRIHDAIRHQVEAERRAVWARTCPGRGCSEVTATDEEIAAAREAQPWGWSPRWCPPCEEQAERERAEQQQRAREAEQRAREARAHEVRVIRAWAEEVLTDPLSVVLDCETTGLDDDACMVELAAITAAGDVLVNTLVQPGVPIPRQASDIHGITDDDVKSAPTFSDLLVRLTAALDGRRILIYNAPYDVMRLRWELTRHYRATGHPEPAKAAAAWLDAIAVEDVMMPYSDWVGEWSEYHGNNRWQPLDGGHRALGDCRAVIARLQEITAQDDED